MARVRGSDGGRGRGGGQRDGGGGAAIAAAAMVTTSPAVTGPLSRRPFIRNGVNVRCSRVMSMVSTLGIPGGDQNPADHRIDPEAPLPGWADLTAVLGVRTPETAVKAGW